MALMAFCTSAVNSGLTMPLLLTTADTVEMDTPETLATSRIVYCLRFAMRSEPLPVMIHSYAGVVPGFARQQPGDDWPADGQIPYLQ